MREKAPIRRMHLYCIAADGRAIDAFDRAGKYPWMAAQQGFFAARFKDDGGLGGGVAGERLRCALRGISGGDARCASLRFAGFRPTPE